MSQDTIELTGDAHDCLTWFKKEGETLSETLHRLMLTMPGPAEFERADVDRRHLDEENFVFLHLPTPDGNYRTSVYRGPGHLMSEQAEVIGADGSEEGA